MAGSEPAFQSRPFKEDSRSVRVLPYRHRYLQVQSPARADMNPVPAIDPAMSCSRDHRRAREYRKHKGCYKSFHIDISLLLYDRVALDEPRNHLFDGARN